MAYKQDNLFIAACLDLSLAAQANSMEEAVTKLDAQIQSLIVDNHHCSNLTCGCR